MWFLKCSRTSVHAQPHTPMWQSPPQEGQRYQVRNHRCKAPRGQTAPSILACNDIVSMSHIFLPWILVSYRVGINRAVAKVATHRERLYSMHPWTNWCWAEAVHQDSPTQCVHVQSHNKSPACHGTPHSGILLFTNEWWPVWGTLSTYSSHPRTYLRAHMLISWRPDALLLQPSDRGCLICWRCICTLIQGIKELPRGHVCALVFVCFNHAHSLS